MTIHQIIFSPTGGTRRVSDYICKGIGTGSLVTDLCIKAEEFHSPDIATEDLSVIAMPVFAGRVPALAVERLNTIKGNGARCVIVAVYGNRAFDDALLEMKDIAIKAGFRVIAAIGAVAEHSIVRKYGKGRPDADDINTLQQFGKEIAHKIRSNEDSPIKVPGNYPYKKPNKGPYPTAGRKCNTCGICAKGCPTGAISLTDIRKVDKQKCISCMKCVAACPTHTRDIGMIMNFLIAKAIKKPCASRKNNELFI